MQTFGNVLAMLLGITLGILLLQLVLARALLTFFPNLTKDDDLVSQAGSILKGLASTFGPLFKIAIGVAIAIYLVIHVGVHTLAGAFWTPLFYELGTATFLVVVSYLAARPKATS